MRHHTSGRAPAIPAVVALVALAGPFAASPAWADWTLVSSADGTSHFIDPVTLRKDGALRRVWELASTEHASKGGAASHRMLIEYDCAAQRYRLLMLTAYTEPMAAGKVFATTSHAPSAAQWHDAKPGTVSWDALQQVCRL